MSAALPIALPTGRTGRLLALAVTLLILAAGWFAIGSPLVAWHADRAELLDQRRLLARRMAGIAQSLPELRQTAGAGVASPGLGSPSLASSGSASSGAAAPASLLDGATDAIAAAALQQLVQDMAGRAGASLATAETLPPVQAGTYRRIGLHVSLNAPWSVLMRLLLAIGQAAPRMLVDDLQVHAPRLVVQPEDPPLDAGFTVFAFRPAPATAPR